MHLNLLQEKLTTKDQFLFSERSGDWQISIKKDIKLRHLRISMHYCVVLDKDLLLIVYKFSSTEADESAKSMTFSKG